MISLVLLFSFLSVLAKPHRTVASKTRSNKPLQASPTFTGTICASAEATETCDDSTVPVTNASVYVDGARSNVVTIDSDGTFSISLDSGEHTISVVGVCPFQNGTDSSENVTSTQTVTIVSGEVTTASFPLQCSSLLDITVPVVVQVCVGCNETTGCDENGTALIEGRMMALVPVENGTDVPSSTIDAEGNGTFDSVIPGDYYVHVYDEPYGSSTIEVAGQITVAEPGADEEEPETQYFGPLLLPNNTLCYDPTYITGRVCADCEAEPPTPENPSNGSSTGCTTPLANATVRLTVVSDDGEEAVVEATTNELGVYELEPANITGNYTLEVFSADCTGSDDDVFATLTGEINATAPEPRTEVNVSAFCTTRCTANISGLVFVAENDTANYTEGITDPLSGITIDLIEGDVSISAVGDILAPAVTAEDGSFEFLNVPFGVYTVTARDVPTAGGPTGEGCALGFDDISIVVDVDTNITYNVTIVRAEECNNATLCGQILFAANYCTGANSTDNSTGIISLSLSATNCSCNSSNSSFPVRPFPPPPGFFPPYPPPPPPFGPNSSEIQRLWSAFLLGTNYPTSAAYPPTEEEAETEEEEESLQNSRPRRVLKNQRIPINRCPPPPCPHPPCPRPPCPRPPCPPVPPMPPSSDTCNCSVNGTFEGCVEVLAPMPTAIARLYRNATVGVPVDEETPELFQIVAETAVLPNGSFCFTGLPEGDNYVLEVIVSENDTLDLARSNISEALGAITSTIVAQDGAYPPTQQVLSFGPMTLTGAEENVVDPFTLVFTNEELEQEATVRLANATFVPIPSNSTNDTVVDNSTDIGPNPPIRFVDPFGYPYHYPLSSKPARKSASGQIVRPSAKKTQKKRKPSGASTQSADASTITVIRPQPQKQTTNTKTLRPSSTEKPGIRRPAPPKGKPAQNKTNQKRQESKTTRRKTVTKRQGSSSTVITRSS